MADLKSLLDEFRNEEIARQEQIKKIVEQEVTNIKVKISNLDTDLYNKIMAKQSTQTTGKPPKNPKAGMPTPQENDVTIDKVFQEVVDDLLVGNNVYLYGKAGTGKTVLAKNVAKYLNVGEKDNYYIINCSQWTSPATIIGGYTIDGYKSGQLELAWRYGGVLILDELPKLDPNTAGLLNDALSNSNQEGAEITNGNGEKIVKHPHFYVIGAGNTDMKTVGANFSGNNRQDYSLVDRFTGSYYLIGPNEELERRYTYQVVYSIGNGLREFLERDANSIEAISLRSMLNFNRIYEMQMLRSLRSPLTFKTAGTDGETDAQAYSQGKTLEDSINSFVKSLGDDRERNLKANARFVSTYSQNTVSLDEIIKEANTNLSLFRSDYARIKGQTIAEAQQELAEANKSK